MAKSLKVLLLPTVIFVLAAISADAALERHMYMDELVFIRLSQNLPNYSTTTEWFEEYPEVKWDIPEYMPQDIWSRAYDKPIWTHPPLASFVVYPLVRLTENIHILRILSVMLLALNLALVSLLLARRAGYVLLIAFFVPFLSAGLFAGSYWFYYEPFMLTLFLLTLVLQEFNRGGNLKFVTASAMVLSKLPAVLYLLPLALKDKRFALCSLVLLPYLASTWLTTGNPFYLIEHWTWQRLYYAQPHVVNFVIPNALSLIAWWGLVPYAILTVPGAIYILLKRRDEYHLLLFWLVTLTLGFGHAFITYQLFPIIYSGMLMSFFTIQLFVETLRREVELSWGWYALKRR